MPRGTLLTPRRGLQTGWGLTTTARLFAPVVLLVLAYERGGAGLLAATSAALAVIGAVMSAIVGHLGDRGDLGRVIRWLVVVSTLALALAALGSVAQWSVLVVLALGVSSCGLLQAYRPLQAAILPWLVHTPRELAAANVASTAIESVASLVGPALAGTALLLLSSDKALLIAAAIVGLIQIGGSLPRIARVRWRDMTNDRVPKACILVSFVFAFVAALAPEIEHDALWYHLWLPQQWLGTGRPVDIIHEYVSLYPLSWELLYGAAMTIGGPVAARLLHFACLPLLAAALT